jgi:hypothetical protein
MMYRKTQRESIPIIFENQYYSVMLKMQLIIVIITDYSEVTCEESEQEVQHQFSHLTCRQMTFHLGSDPHILFCCQ